MKSIFAFRRFLFVIFLLVCGYLGREKMYFTNGSEQSPDILHFWELSVFRICAAPALVRDVLRQMEGKREQKQRGRKIYKENMMM